MSFNKFLFYIISFGFFPFTVFFAKSDDNINLECNDHRCATFLPQHIKNRYTKNDMIQFGQRPVCQKSYSSPQGNFLFHYDVTGFHKVPAEDNNHNEVPDFVDSAAYHFERAYSFYKDSLGMISPIPDSGGGGTDQFDVYFQNCGEVNGFYGYTDGDKEIYPLKKFPRYTSFTIIDNDFSPTDSIRGNDGKAIQRAFNETGFKALRITACHEFFHAVQMQYGIPSSAFILAEMTSTWFEYRLNPDSKDFYQYVRHLFKHFDLYPFGIPEPEAGYKYSIFFQYIYKKFGDRPLVRIWELISNGMNGYPALDSALKECGGGLVYEWKEFIPWLYFTGTRAKGNMYFDNAEEYPMVTFKPEMAFTPTELVLSDSLTVFELRPMRFHLPAGMNTSDDTLDIFYSNIDYDRIKGDLIWDPPYIPITFTCSNISYPECIAIENSDYCLDLIHDANKIYYITYYYHGQPVTEISYAFPSPFRIGTDATLFLPAPANSRLNEYVNLIIYNVEMNEIYSGKHQIIPAGKNSAGDGYKAVKWEQFPADFSSGVYIFNIEYKDSQRLGKFTVLK